MKKIILTGDRPSGLLHLGHYIGSLKNRVILQHEYQQYVMIADVQALTDYYEEPEKVRQSIFEVTRDYLAAGIDPQVTTIFVQSQIPELAELTIYFLNLVTIARLERNPTVKTEIQQKGFAESIPAGFLCYPVSQAADITLFQGDVVPVGEDQLPVLEQTNEIVRKFCRIYKTDCLKECEALLSTSSRLVGIDGKGKASKSLGNAIYLSDSAKELKRKVSLMYTDPGHLKISDPGQIEGNVVFTYLDAFHEDQEEVSALKEHYRRGGLGDGTVKNVLFESLDRLLSPMREKRLSYTDEDIAAILKDGTERARKSAREHMQRIRQAMGLFSI